MYWLRFVVTMKRRPAGAQHGAVWPPSGRGEELGKWHHAQGPRSRCRVSTDTRGLPLTTPTTLPRDCGRDGVDNRA